MLVAFAQAKLLIQSPMRLREKFEDGKIKASYANFGYIPYGHSMVSLLILSDLLGLGWQNILRQEH